MMWFSSTNPTIQIQYSFHSPILFHILPVHLYFGDCFGCGCVNLHLETGSAFLVLTVEKCYFEKPRKTQPDNYRFSDDI